MVKKLITTADIINRSISTHADRYDYSKTEYIDSATPMTITCKIHGDFTQLPANHTKGCGCNKCGNALIGDKLRKSVGDFIAQANILHNNFYDYSNVVYLHAHKPVEILCHEHGKFYRSPDVHLNHKLGCPSCHTSSKIETVWLDKLKIPTEFRQHWMILDSVKMKTDAYDPITNTVYEFWGDFWHGNPRIFDANDVNICNKKTFGQLYKETQRKRTAILNNGYNLIEIWEIDFEFIQILNGVIETMKISPENTARLKQLVKDGVSVMQECEDLKQGLSETIKAVAEEMEIKPTIITKFIKDVQKNKINDRREDNDVMEELIKIAGFE